MTQLIVQSAPAVEDSDCALCGRPAAATAGVHLR